MTPRHVTLAAALCFAGASLGQEKARERILFSALDRNSRTILGLGVKEVAGIHCGFRCRVLEGDTPWHALKSGY